MSGLPLWIPRSSFGAILAAVYLITVIWVVQVERKSTGGGNWISLRGIASYLATFPVSVVCEWLGAKLDFRRNADMGAAIVICVALVYLIGAGVGKLAQMMFST